MGNDAQSGKTDLVKAVIYSSGGASAIPAASEIWQPIVREKRLVKVMKSLELRLPQSVRELAQEVHLSPTHLQRLFKQETGVHISELLCERRLTVAARLLTTTKMGVKEIAFLVGYGHHPSFVRAFQRRYGQSPKQFRQAQVA